MAKILYVSPRDSTLPKILRERGYNVKVAKKGFSALASKSVEPIKVVISDIDLPDMRTPVLIEQLKLRWPNLMTIYLLENLEEDKRKIGFDQACIGLEKCCPTHLLLAIVSHWMQKEETFGSAILPRRS